MHSKQIAKILRISLSSSLGCLILGWGSLAQANTQRGDSGLSFGSEAAPIGQPSLSSGGNSGGSSGDSSSGGSGGAAPTASGGPPPASSAGVESQKGAQTAIDAANEQSGGGGDAGSGSTGGGSIGGGGIGAPSSNGGFTIQIEGGGSVTISIDAPEVASSEPVAVGAGKVKLSIAIDNGRDTPQQRTFEMSNIQTARRISATLGGVLKGLSSLKASPESMEQGIALVTKLGSVPQAEAIAPGQIAGQLVVLLALFDKLPEEELKRDEKYILSDAINAYNDLVKRSRPEVLVVLAQQKEFQTIESQLRGLRAAVDAN